MMVMENINGNDVCWRIREETAMRPMMNAMDGRVFYEWCG